MVGRRSDVKKEKQKTSDPEVYHQRGDANIRFYNKYRAVSEKTFTQHPHPH